MRAISHFLIRLLTPYKKAILWCSLLAIAAAALSLLSPIALGKAIDAASHKEALWIVLGSIAAWLLLGHLASRLRGYLNREGSNIAYEAVNAYKLEAVAALVRKPLSFHYGKRGGDVTERLSKFEDELVNVISGVIFDLGPTALTIAAILAYLTWLDWKVALLLGLSIAGVVFEKIRTLPAAMKSQTAWRGADREIGSTAWDAIKNILVVKSTSAETRLSTRLAALREKLMETVRFDNALDEQMHNNQNLIIQFGTALVLGVALLNVHAGTFSIGQFTAISAYALTVFGHVGWIQWQMRNLTRAAANQKEMEKIMEEPEEAYDAGRDADIKGGLEFRNVRYRYRDDVPVLEDISFSVKPGERIALVGESGEGKTTLIDLIGRYHLPQSGTILYDGIDAKDVNLRSLRSQIGLVPQDLPMLHESVGENIRYGRPDATDEELREAARLASLESFIASLPDGYDTLVGERGMKLSGGQRQRVALARAFLRNPKILILDEPTSNLDSKTEAEIQHALEILMRGRTTFIIAHRLSTVRDADRIMVIKGGRVAEQGRHDELVAKNGVYVSLLRSQGGLVAADEVKEDEE